MYDTDLFRMVADSFRRSDAPRFLISLFTLDAGEHRILPDHPHFARATDDVWLTVEDGEDLENDGGDRRVRLSFPAIFEAGGDEAEPIFFPTVWYHFLVADGAFKEALTLEETLPDQFDYIVDLQSLAAGSLAIEDLCDACAMPRSAAVVGKEPATPLESIPAHSAA